MEWLKAIDGVEAQLRNAPWDDKEYYKEFLAQIYYFVRKSTRMLAAAAAVTDSTPYYDRLVEHIGEENKHELLALGDLKKLGGKIEDHPELGITRALWEPQFYKIQRTPTSLLGYILALEIVAVRVYPELMKDLETRYGKPAINFVRVHGEEDPAHVDKAIDQVRHLSEGEQKAVIENFEQTCAVLGCFMDAIKAQAAKRSEATRTPTRAAKRAA